MIFNENNQQKHEVKLLFHEKIMNYQKYTPYAGIIYQIGTIGTQYSIHMTKTFSIITT